MKYKTLVVIEKSDKSGKLVEKVVVENQLITEWFRRWMAGTVTPHVGIPLGWTFTDETGAPRTFHTWHSPHPFTGRSPGLAAVKLAWGTGDTPATRMDYALAFKIGEVTPVSGVISINTATEYEISYGGSAMIGTTVTVKEAGLFYQPVDTGGLVRWIMLDRVVLPTPIGFVPGETLTITYKVKIMIE